MTYREKRLKIELFFSITVDCNLGITLIEILQFYE